MIRGSVKAADGSAGVLAGDLKDSQVRNCSVSGSVEAAEKAGGIAGEMSGCRLANCANEAEITGGTDAGGLAGGIKDSEIENSYSTGSVTGGAAAGGLAGAMENTAADNCYAAGTVQGSGICGSVFGTAADGAATAVYYLADTAEDAVGTGISTGLEPFERTRTDLRQLLRFLNRWVQSQSSPDYLTWINSAEAQTQSVEYDLPTFGDVDLLPDAAGQMEFQFYDDGTVEYRFQADLLDEHRIFAASYSDTGRMLSIIEIRDEEGSFSLENGAVRLKAFAVSREFTPAEAADFDVPPGETAADVRTDAD